MVLLRRALPTRFLFEDGGEAAVAMVVHERRCWMREDGTVVVFRDGGAKARRWCCGNSRWLAVVAAPLLLLLRSAPIWLRHGGSKMEAALLVVVMRVAV